MNQIYIKARAKINLSLDIVGKRDDGYHDISTVMQSLSLFDSIEIKKVHKPDYHLKIVSNMSWLPNDDRNLAWQAAEYLIDRFDIKEGIFIGIQKAIPSSAGLAGGSADCAATLLAVTKLFALPLHLEEIIELSSQFGADVPFCVMQGCAHATGIGEILNPLPKIPYVHIVLAKPPSIVSTEDVFRNFRLNEVKKRPDTEKVIYSIKAGDLKGICDGMGNVLENVTEVKYPLISEIKNLMIKQGAEASMMTGSGPTVFGIFTEKRKAIACAKLIKSTYPDLNEIFVTKPYSGFSFKSNTK